ncbi:hypothetical protein BOX15_Mlig001404g2 [Macrostomum lignano]|uniref:MAGE domain-containing protein n=3 Tax=Macrostomum lignano TaxID=282301 RepID=A0A1I8HYY7_9PLAT|nr:hypothetical protein BOX15_Mlig001404g2 [Macrostomum lignano]
MGDEEEEDDYESYLYYIHRWHCPDEPEDAPISIAGMEAYIMRVLGEEVMQMRDPIDTDMAAFYHDNWDSGKMKLATADSFADHSHENVRRVLGCGHFVLCLLYMTLNCMEVQEGPAWPYARFWPRMRENLLGTGLLDRKTTCHAAGVYRWMQGFLFKNIFKRIEDDDPYKEIVRIPLTKLRVMSSPCNPKADESTEKFKQNYNEFLLLHLYVMDEMHIMESDSHRDQYLNLMRRRSKSKSGWTRPVMDKTFLDRGGSLRAAMSSRRRRKMLVDEPRAETQQSPDSHQEQKQQPQKEEKPESEMHESKPSQGAGQAKIRGNDGTIHFPKPSTGSKSWRRRGRGATSLDESTNGTAEQLRWHRWHRSANYRSASSWRGWSASGTTTRIREVDRHWRLGCIGCRPGMVVSKRLPRQVSRSKQHRRRTRLCKWITVKRTVLVRRLL